MTKLKLFNCLIIILGLIILMNPISSGNEFYEESIVVNQDINKNIYLDIPYLIKEEIKDKNDTGSLYIDYNIDLDNTNKIIIYGKSNDSYELPFNFLDDYTMNTFFEENAYLYFTVNELQEKYRIFSVFLTNDETSYNKLSFLENEYLLHLNDLQNRSLYNINYQFNDNDKLIIMVSNSIEKKGYNIVVCAVKIDEM